MLFRFLLRTGLMAGAWLAGLLLAHAHAGEVQLAVAANFAAPAKRLAQDFERQTGHRV